VINVTYNGARGHLKQLADALETLSDPGGADPGDEDLSQGAAFCYLALGDNPIAFDIAGMGGSEVIWADDGDHIDACHCLNGSVTLDGDCGGGGSGSVGKTGFKGYDVFQYEQEVCDKLVAYKLNGENSSIINENSISVNALLQNLINASDAMASLAIQDATDQGGDPSIIDQATQFLNQAQSEASNGDAAICDEALDLYGKAWLEAVKSWCPLE